MRRGKRKLMWGAGILLALLAIFIIPTVWLQPWSIDHYYGRVFLRFALRHPMMLTGLGMLDGTPLDFHSDKLDDMSMAMEDKEARFVDEELAMLRRYKRAGMAPGGRLSYDVLEWFLVDQQQANHFLRYDYPVNQLFGIQSGLPDFMINLHPLKQPRQAEAFVARVSQFGRAFDQVLDGLKAREKAGVVPPRFVIEKVLTEMKGFAAHPPAENPMMVRFVSRLDSIPGLSDERKTQLREALERQIRETVIPAYGRLIAYHEHLLTVATDDDGVWKLPDGDAYYDQCVRSRTTTDMPADSIHELGRRETAGLQAQMMEILARQGYRGKPLAAAMKQISEEPRFRFASGDSGRAAILAGYRSIIEDSQKRMDKLFGVKPAAGVTVERIPEFKEATSPGAYYQASSIGGARPGTFYANLRDPGETRRYEMRTLAYHEAVPGHHFQISIQQELKGVPFFRRIIPFTAYAEGWGLYAERVAYENGFHHDAFDSLGALQAELFRAVRLVVDTGIHRKHWTRQQAIDYMVENTGMSQPEVVTEIERYIVNPAQACAYKVGQLKILELREHARERLGARFDIRGFHDVVLKNGSLPLGLLERVVDEWVAEELKKPSAQDRG